MKLQAHSISALAMATAVAIAPTTTAIAATSSSTSPSASVSATPAAVLKSIASAPVVANSAASVAPSALGTFVVVTDEAVRGAPEPTAGAATAASAAPAIELPGVPTSVTDILTTAGLPVQAVYRVLQTGQGVYTIWYKMLTSVPQAIFKGEFGSVPTLFQTAISDSLTWITTGAGPKAPETTKAAAVSGAETAAAPSPISAALDVVGIPVATAYAAGQAGLSIYQSFYGLLTSVPQAAFQGRFGDAAGLVVDAVAKSITTIVDFPSTQLQAAADKVTTLVTALTPAATEATVTSADVRALSVDSAGQASDVTAAPSVAVGGDQKASDDVQKPVERTVASTSRLVTEALKPSESKQVAPTETPVSRPSVEPAKPVDGGVVESTPTGSTAAPGESSAKGVSPAAESASASAPKATVDPKATDSKPVVDAAANDSKPVVDPSSETEARPAAEDSAGADEKPTSGSGVE